MAASYKPTALLKGLGVHIADINVMSSGTVPFTNLHPAEPIQVNDTIIDSNGDAYLVASVATDSVKVGAAIQGVSFKGPQGAAGTGLTLKGSVATKDDLPADNNTAGDSYLVAGHLYTWDGTQWVDGGNVQGPSGEGFHTASAALADDGTVAIADLVPNTSVTVGDSVVDANGDVRPIVSTDDTNATLGKKTINLKGATGQAGKDGATGAAGAGVHVSTATIADSGTVALDTISPANPAVGDTVIDAAGNVYQIASKGAENATVGKLLANIKGATGAPGEKGETGVKSATITALAADAEPTVSVDDKGVLALGIPAGAKGDPGVAGKDGAAGVRGSRATFVEDTTTITDALPGDYNINPVTGVLSVYSND